MTKKMLWPDLTSYYYSRDTRNWLDANFYLWQWSPNMPLCYIRGKNVWQWTASTKSRTI